MFSKEPISFDNTKPTWDRWVSAFFIFIIFIYQRTISPVLGAQCRFYPSCSQYARLALYYRPFFTAIWLIIRRLAKCQPFHPGGYDPIGPLGDEKPPLTSGHIEKTESRHNGR